MSKIFIYGSCVSRDSYNFAKDRHSLTGYVARQSFISATSCATQLLPGTEMKSQFQNRMLQGDLSSNVLEILRMNISEIDLLVIDLTDERLGVHKLSDSSFVTRSTELVTSGRLRQLDQRPGLIRFGTERHAMFWTRSYGILLRKLSAMNLLSKTVIIDTPWALSTLEEPGFSSSTLQETEQARIWMARYVQHCASLGARILSMPEEYAVATNQHRWGLAPYHYTDDAYRWIVNQWDNCLREIGS